MTKQGLRGFAGGLIVATLLLSYVYFYHSDKASTTKITEADIENYAEKNNLVFITKEEYNNLTKQKDTKSKLENPKEKDKAKDKNQNQTKPSENKANNESKNTENQQKPVTVQLEIKPGMSTSEVGEELQRLKLISNKSEFTNYIKKRKLESSVKAGSFKLNSDMTVEEIAAVLTK